jgi:hypothetical protein
MVSFPFLKEKGILNFLFFSSHSLKRQNKRGKFA